MYKLYNTVALPSKDDIYHRILCCMVQYRMKLMFNSTGSQTVVGTGHNGVILNARHLAPWRLEQSPNCFAHVDAKLKRWRTPTLSMPEMYFPGRHRFWLYMGQQASQSSPQVLWRHRHS